jgi:hypothetical protein
VLLKFNRTISQLIGQPSTDNHGYKEMDVVPHMCNLCLQLSNMH